MKSNTGEVFNIYSPIDSRQHDDALLGLLWKYKGKQDSFTLTCLEFLAKMLQDPCLATFFSQIPGINYNSHRFLDWVLPYLADETVKAKKYSGIGTEDKLKKISNIEEQFTIYQSLLPDTPKPYLINSVSQEQLVSEQIFEDTVQVKVIQVSGTFMLSKPTSDL